MTMIDHPEFGRRDFADVLLDHVHVMVTGNHGEQPEAPWGDVVKLAPDIDGCFVYGSRFDSERDGDAVRFRDKITGELYVMTVRKCGPHESRGGL
jgi:hypothetical protein